MQHRFGRISGRNYVLRECNDGTRFHYLLSSREIAILKKVFEEDLEFFQISIFPSLFDMIIFHFCCCIFKILFLVLRQKIETKRVNYTSDVPKMPDLHRFTNFIFDYSTSNHSCIRVQFFLRKKYAFSLADQCSDVNEFYRGKMIGTKLYIRDETIFHKDARRGSRNVHVWYRVSKRTESAHTCTHVAATGR